MRHSYFPDINLWLALSSGNHMHYEAAWAWYRSLAESEELYFCRQTQLGLLRLLTSKSAIADMVCTQRAAWQVYEQWRIKSSVGFLDEPAGIDAIFRAATDRDEVSPKVWTDAYLSAFAEAAGLTLVTFDKALAGKAKGGVLLT